jgi:hypothetical protein
MRHGPHYLRLNAPGDSSKPTKEIFFQIEPARATFFQNEEDAKQVAKRLGDVDVEVVSFLIYDSPIAGERMVEV